MTERFFAATSIALVLLLGVPARAFAQSESAGEIRIVVTDADTKAPVDLARVLLSGSIITSEVSGPTGQVVFTDVPDGIYTARVFKRGYNAVTSARFEVLEGRSVTVNVALAIDTGGLKVIGSVSVKSTASVSTTSIGQDSAQRKLSNDLADAMNKLSGVSVSTSGDDTSSTQTISLEGQDSSQTQLTLDGIPVSAPGAGGNLGSFNTDLFSGASVSFGPQLGGLAGGVNFRTIDPTISWLSQITGSVGSFGKYNYSLAESGSDGKLGLAAMVTNRLQPSLIDGDVYLDASGLDYVHEGDVTSNGALLKLRFTSNDSQSLTGTFLSSTRDAELVCLRFSGALPCGYGPGNYANGSTQLYSLTDNALIGDTTIQASVFSTNSKNLQDQLQRYVDGEAQPIGYGSSTTSTGFTATGDLPSKDRHTFSVTAYGTQSSAITTPLVPEAQPYYNSTQTSGYAAIQLNDTIHSNAKLTLLESAGINGANNAQTSVLASTGLTWRPTSVDTYTASYAVGGAAPQPSRSQILTDPASMRFDCNGNVAYGNAPGEQPGASSSISARVGYTRSMRVGNVSVQIYRQVQNDVVLPTQVNGTVLEALGDITPQYIAEIEQVFQSAGGCNTTATLGASQLYFTTPIGGVTRVYEGGQLTGFASLGGLVVEPYYDVTVSKALSNDLRINNPYSITIPGNQLPNVPLQKAGVVLDYKARHSAIEWLADAQYVAANNPNNLPAYTTYDAGASLQTAHGSLTGAVSNITNTYAGVFTSPANSVPYTTLGGIKVPTLARPLTPRSYSLTYTVRFGAGASQLSNGTLASRQGASAGGGRGGFGGAALPLPTSPPVAPFDVTQDPSRCAAADAATASQLSTALKSFVAAIEAAKTPSGYPATMTPPVPDDATITYHGMGTTYALAIVPKGTVRLRALFGCLPVHIARDDDVKARNLYVPASTVFFRPQLNFMPVVGLYVYFRPQQPGRETFRFYALPSSPPANAFAIVKSDRCGTDVSAIASPALAELNAYFSSGRATKPKLWTVTAHAATAGAWYELDAADPSAIPAIIACGHVAAGQSADLKKLGFDGVRPPELNYAPALGIYLVQPTPGEGPPPSSNAPGPRDGRPSGGGPPPGGPPGGGPPGGEGGPPPP